MNNERAGPANSKPKSPERRFTVQVTEDELKLLLDNQCRQLNELGRERLLGFAEGLLAAQDRNSHPTRK